MSKLEITIGGLEGITAAVIMLAEAISGKNNIGTTNNAGIATGVSMPPAQQAAPIQPVPQAPVQQQAPMQPVPQAPVQQAPVQPVPQAPVQQATPIQQAPVQTAPIQQPSPAVPTTAVPQAYSQEQLAVAATGLVDQGKMQVVTGIMQAFGAQSLMQIPPERYAEVALKLREAGANI